MSRKLLYVMLIFALVLALPSSMGAAQSGSAKPTPRPIGAIQPASKHLVQPRQDVVLRNLEKEGAIPFNASQKQKQGALDQYYSDFSKRSSEWINPKIQQNAIIHEQELANTTQNPQADPPAAAISVKVFALAVDFGATETITYTVPGGADCVPTSTTVSGPLEGEIAQPGPLDNNTIWYSPEQTGDPNFYSNLIFGYEGVGRVRPDLFDPKDGQPGINLAGYTVQDYYDHFAGKGNVTLEGMALGWVTVNHAEGYYGAPNCLANDTDGGTGAPPAQLVVDAVDQFQAEHPSYYNDTSPTAFWPQFDANKDGILDTFWTIHAGMGEEAGGGAQGEFSIWSHSFDLRAYPMWQNGYKVYEGDPNSTADDIYIGPYTIQPENLDLGVVVEEFGHNFFGLPDIYTTDAQNSSGFWTEMGAGSWGGYLGGGTPVGMPLWFRMISWCDTSYCNWQYPMVTRDYKDPAADIVLGQLDGFPGGGGVNKGVRINLPTIPDTVANKAGTGKGAYTGTGIDNVNQVMVRTITLPAAAPGVFSFNSYWDIEKDWDYGYLEAKKSSDTTWTMLCDMDGKFTKTNPNGTNDGCGLTGKSSAPFRLRFDLSSFVDPSDPVNVDIRLRYKTDTGTTLPGWWVDDVMHDATLVDDFETAVEPDTFPGWTNDPDFPWLVVPYNRQFTNYYLVEWRSDSETSKYDQALRTAYVTTDSTADEWRVERVPYNIPGALLWYRNTKYGEGYSQTQYYGDPPSYGPKNKILVVDVNYQPMRLFDAEGYEGSLNSRASSYDAALTLQPSQAFGLSKVYGLLDAGPFSFVSKPAVTSFNDTLGYYAGFYYGDPCPPGYICYANTDGSVVIPARDKYSTRITDFGGNPFYGLYGAAFSPSWLGSGNPGDDMVQLGMNVRLLSQSADHTTGTVRVYNYSVDFETTASLGAQLSPTHGEVIYTTVVTNSGTETATNVSITYNLDSGLNFVYSDCPGTLTTSQAPEGMIKVCNIPSLAAGASRTIHLAAETLSLPYDTTTRIEAHDGQVMRGPWWYDFTVSAFGPIFMPLIVR
jgi:immune inhibitor A